MDPRPQTSEAWHHLPEAEALGALDASTAGLSSEDAKKRQTQYGLNQLPAPARRSVWMRFLLQFHNILIYVLLGAVLITFILGHRIDSAVIMAVVLVNAIIGFFQEGKAEKAMDAIRKMLAPDAHVIRDGVRQSVPVETLVPGDVVLLEAGDKVPADMRMLQARRLQAQEAILTGESLAVEKQTQPVAEDATLGDRRSMCYSGTFITAGQGKGLVVATGSTSEIGRISGMLSEVETLTTPLVRQMQRFAKWLTAFILGFSSLILLFGYYVQGHAFSELFLSVVGLSVAAIPEGLPAVLTITLAIGVQAMARRHAIVRRLPAIETLGSVSVICTDKTGTLTRNEMMVASLVTSDAIYEVSGEGYAPEGTIQQPESAPYDADHHDADHLVEIGRVASLCNDAQLHEKNGSWQVEGDPMEGALLAFSHKTGAEPLSLAKDWQRTDAIPFDSQHRFMATLNHGPDSKAIIAIKGAPEKILQMCRHQRGPNGETQPLDADLWQQRSETIAREGQRVLALAVKSGTVDQTALSFEEVQQDCVLLGMVGMMDPPRRETIDAIADCYRAGIDVKMITGDHAATAAAIGAQIGLKHRGRVVTGRDIETMDDAALQTAVMESDIFARTSPEHKLRLVMALQAQGQTVAMTGDGVNDAPALKRADAGIAMGRSGSEAAKEAAELVLANDDFASIAAAVKEGRTVYDNLKKVISFLLPVNGGESLSLVIAILLGLTLPISPVQILWINMVSSVALAMALAFEPAEPQTMQRPPRPVNAPILSGFLIWRIFFVSLLFSAGVFGQFLLAKSQGIDLDTARTMTVNTLVVMEIFYLFSVRYIHGTSLTWRGVLGTKAVLLAVGIVTLLQFLFTYAPFMQLFFASRPLSFMQGMQIIAFGIVVLSLLEMEKMLYRKLWRCA